MNANAITKELDNLMTSNNIATESKITALYLFAKEVKANSCDWYWMSIKRKKKAAFTVLLFVFILVIVASLIQFCLINLNALGDGDKFFYSQCSVGLYTLAAILFLMDKVFGWTTGWVRYVTTVMDIQKAYDSFIVEWFSFPDETRPELKEKVLIKRLELVKNIIKTINDKQYQETIQWATEFGDGVNQLRSFMNNLKVQPQSDIQPQHKINVDAESKKPDNNHADAELK